MLEPDEDQWDTLAKYDKFVFAKTTPEQKLRIVKQFAARHETVAGRVLLQHR